ncbi:MAG: ABC transporter permease [Halococcoides sp.]
MIGRQWRIQRALTTMAARNLRRSGVRTGLAVLGIVIGVVAIASIGALGVAFQTSFSQQVSEVTYSAVVTPGDDATQPYLTDRDVRAIRQYTDVEVFAVATGSARVTAFGNSERTSVYGFERPDRTLDARSGSVPEVWRSGAIVGSELADDLGVDVGDSVTVDGQRHRVVAVLEPVAGQFSLLEDNDRLYLPPTTVDRQGYSQVVLKAESVPEINATAQTLRERLNDRGEVYDVQDFTNVQDQIQEQFALIRTFLMAIGGISLFVAAVSILNVMLMSVMERRTEIGVLRAVGYHRGDVLRLILSEAILIGTIGTVVGVLITLLVTMAINGVMLGNPLAFSAQSAVQIAIGAAFGVVASAVSGLYPAWKAANEHPVDALRG